MRTNWQQRVSLLAMLGLLLVTAPIAIAAPDLLVQGDQQWATGNLNDALVTFTQAVKAAPRSVNAKFKLAGVQLSLNDFAAAIQTYQSIIGIEPKNVRAWLGLGISYMHTGHKALSRAAFEEVVRIEPQRKEPLSAVLTKLSQAD